MGRPIKDNIMFFSHDANASRHWKFNSLRNHYAEKGWAMEGRYWALNGMIAESEGCRLDLSRAAIRLNTANILDLSLQELDDFVHFLTDHDSCDLLNSEGGIVWTDRCDEELNSARKARESDRRRKGEYSERNPTGKTSILAGFHPDNDSNPAGKVGFSGEVEQPSLAGSKEAARPENPPAAASFSSLLKNTLAAAGILISPPDLDACASKLIASSADSPAFLDFAVDKCRRAKQRGTWFVKGVLEWDWVGKWRAAGNGSSTAPSTPQPGYHTPTTDEMAAELAASTPEEEKAAAAKAAQFKHAHAMPLSDQERELLGLPAPPPVEQLADDFEDDPLPAFPEVK